MAEFLPADFSVPVALETPGFGLEPLGPEHNEQDYAAWTSSLEHIAATPGYAGLSWPREMTPDENRSDLQRHRARDRNHEARVHSWVRESRAELDAPLWRAVSEWLASDWPFRRVDYAPRASA